MQAYLIKIFLALELIIPVKYGCRKPEKLSKRVNKLDKLTGKNIKITRLIEKDIFKIVTLKEFVHPNKISTSNKLVILEKILSNT